ncbi:hypothetical protein LWI28_000973 [Acer negundo]|uniref:Uncharacterized protein n=1 Tax=Acer negundo TaxID=4023 RepID=A0AAD5J8C0_ACENE|nr:hypothetical protein LWI28_000973 [Acer negundo]
MFFTETNTKFVKHALNFQRAAAISFSPAAGDLNIHHLPAILFFPFSGSVDFLFSSSRRFCSSIISWRLSSPSPATSSLLPIISSNFSFSPTL